MNPISETARQNAMQIEAKKDGLSQLQSGEWVLKLKLHAADIPTPLLKAGMGTRYMLAMVEIGDNEEPVQQEKPKGKSYAQQAGILCNDIPFQKFMDCNSAEEAAEAVRTLCCVISRSEIREGVPAGDIWRKLRADYQNWLKE